MRWPVVALNAGLPEHVPGMQLLGRPGLWYWLVECLACGTNCPCVRLDVDVDDLNGHGRGDVLPARRREQLL
jgi:hypothetical protein